MIKYLLTFIPLFGDSILTIIFSIHNTQLMQNSSLSFLKKSIHIVWCSLFFQRLTSLSLKFFKKLTSPKIVPYKT